MSRSSDSTDSSTFLIGKSFTPRRTLTNRYFVGFIATNMRTSSAGPNLSQQCFKQDSTLTSCITTSNRWKKESPLGTSCPCENGKGATELNQQNKWIRMNYNKLSNMKGVLERTEWRLLGCWYAAILILSSTHVRLVTGYNNGLTERCWHQRKLKTTL